MPNHVSHDTLRLEHTFANFGQNREVDVKSVTLSVVLALRAIDSRFSDGSGAFDSLTAVQNVIIARGDRLGLQGCTRRPAVGTAHPPHAG